MAVVLLPPCATNALRTFSPTHPTHTEIVMRPVLLLSIALLLTACGDDQNTTAPVTRPVARGVPASGDTRVSTQVMAAQGKPTDAVGFTKITTVISTWTFTAGGNGFAHTNCPAGTTAIGGGFGYDLPGGYPTVPAPSMIAQVIANNGWSIALMNNQPGAIAWTIEVAAYCAS
jgi:hypothetical protein